MTADMRWKNDAAFDADLRAADEARLRAIYTWAITGETRALQNGRHNSPSARRGWKSRRQQIEAEFEKRGLDP